MAVPSLETRAVVAYASVLALVGATSFLLLEGNARLRASLGSLFLVLQVLALWRLSWRFRRSARILWLLTALLLGAGWLPWARELWQKQREAGALLGLILLATLVFTAIVVRQWWRERA
jgi:hypothetical protein